MRFGFIAKHRGVWPVSWLCEALGVSRGGFNAWLARAPSARSRGDEEFGAKIRASFVASDRTYGARRVWRDLLAEGLSCGLHRIERLMRRQALKARPRRRGLPKDAGERVAAAANMLDRQFTADAPNRKWIADFIPAFVFSSVRLCRLNLHHARFDVSSGAGFPCKLISMRTRGRRLRAAPTSRRARRPSPNLPASLA